MMKFIVILFLIIIFFSLMSAVYYLLYDRGKSTRMAKALTIRITLSIILFTLLMIAFWMGWITPHAL